MKWITYFNLTRWKNNPVSWSLSNMRYFNQISSLPFSMNTKIKNYNDINDENYKDVLNKERTLLLFGYTDYSHKSLSLFEMITKIEKEIKKPLDIENLNIPLIHKFDVNKNYELVKKLHIKTIPILQLRHEKKLVEEISGEKLQEANIKSVIHRYISYFKPIEFVNRLDDFMRRDSELLQKEHVNTPVLNESSLFISQTEKGEKTKTKEKEEISPQNMLINLEMKYQCKSYNVFKQLELALYEMKMNEMKMNEIEMSEKKMNEMKMNEKKMNEIKNLLNEILEKHDTYLDINAEYNKLMAKAFVYLFNENNVSLDRVKELIDSFLSSGKMDQDISKIITFNEPVISFDNYKNRSLWELKSINQFLFNDNFNDNYVFENKIIQTNLFNINNNKTIENKNDAKYLSRLFRILSVKYFNMDNFEDTLHYALESYKITFPLNNIEHYKSKVLIENILLYLGAYNEKVQKFRSLLEFLYTDKMLRVVRFPHTRAIKGGRPIMKRGKSRKWRWLSHDWKPRWVKKKTKLILEEEWRVVTDKNVPFWN